jgi:hypothetical protein
MAGITPSSRLSNDFAREGLTRLAVEKEKFARRSLQESTRNRTTNSDSVGRPLALCGSKVRGHRICSNPRPDEVIAVGHYNRFLGGAWSLFVVAAAANPVFLPHDEGAGLEST